MRPSMLCMKAKASVASFISEHISKTIKEMHEINNFFKMLYTNSCILLHKSIIEIFLRDASYLILFYLTKPVFSVLNYEFPIELNEVLRTVTSLELFKLTRLLSFKYRISHMIKTKKKKTNTIGSM